MLTQEYLKSILHYNVETGIFSWKLLGSGRKKTVGCLDKKTKYWVIFIKNKLYLAHRLVWLYINGEFPLYIDHKDRNRSNNKISNLRIATHSENMMNRKKQKNKSGFRGVNFLNDHKRSKPWYANINKNNKTIRLGYYSTAIEAAKAYDKAALTYHGEFASLNFKQTEGISK